MQELNTLKKASSCADRSRELPAVAAEAGPCKGRKAEMERLELGDPARAEVGAAERVG